MQQGWGARGWLEVYTRRYTEGPDCSGEGAKVSAEAVGIAAVEEGFGLLAGALPDGNGAGEEGFALGGEVQKAAAAVGRVGRNFQEAAAPERFEGGGEGRSVHAKEIGDGRHARRVGTIEGHEEGKLTIGEFDGTKCVVEAASESSGGTLHVETEAAVTNPECSLEGKGWGT
jgi:hypothetical protein